jgi:hypothetical protein
MDKTDVLVTFKCVRLWEQKQPTPMIASASLRRYPYYYTVGLPKLAGHPELVLSGWWDDVTAPGVLTRIARRIIDNGLVLSDGYVLKEEDKGTRMPMKVAKMRHPETYLPLALTSTPAKAALQDKAGYGEAFHIIWPDKLDDTFDDNTQQLFP